MAIPPSKSTSSLIPALSAAQRDGAAARADAERLARDAERSGAELAEMRAKLDESKAALASNEQMIRWLNQQARARALFFWFFFGFLCRRLAALLF